MRSSVRIQVAGYDWLASEYSIESDLLQPADAFSLSIPNPGGVLSGLVSPFDACTVTVDDVVQMTGWVDDVADRPGVLEIVGRDRFGQLLDTSATPQTLSGLDLQQIAERLATPFVTEWVFDNEENRRKLQQARRRYRYLKRQAEEYSRFVDNAGELTQATTGANLRALDQLRLAKAAANLAAIRAVVFPRIKVQVGESPLQVIERAAAKTDLLVWQAADGRGIIARPNYDQAPAYSIRLYPPEHEDRAENNVQSYSHTRSGRDLFANYRLAGHAANTATTSGEGSRHEVSVTETCALARQLIIARGSGQTRAQAQRELTRDVQRRKFGSEALTYVVEGHAQQGLLWQIDSMVSVDDVVTGRSGAWYCTRRLFRGSLQEGQTTEIELHQPRILLP